MSSSESQQPTQLSSTLKSVQGQVYQAVGAVSTDPSWKEQGDEMVKQAAEESEEAKARAKGEAMADRVTGKAQSAYGMLTGDQEQQTQGNLKAEKGEFKSSIADGTLPIPSAERLHGKLESALGMLTGDEQKQTQGNLKAEKAEWTKG